jgi:hypothetical protein
LQGRSAGLTLEETQIANQRSARRSIEIAEGGHSGGWNAVVDNLGDRRIGPTLRFCRSRDVGGTLASTTVEAVTSGAASFEYLATFGDGPFGLMRFSGIKRFFFGSEGEGERHEQQYHGHDDRPRGGKTDPWFDSALRRIRIRHNLAVGSNFRVQIVSSMQFVTNRAQSALDKQN